LFSDTGKNFKFEFGEYVIEAADLDSLRSVARSAKRIYVHNDSVSLFIHPHSASLEGWSDLSAENARLFIALDGILQNNLAFWRYKSATLFGVVFWFIFLILWPISSDLGYPLGLEASRYSIWGISFILFLFPITMFRRVRIKWATPHQWLPNPSQIISSIIAILVASSIVFMAGAYLSPQLKPYLDRLLTPSPESPDMDAKK
jgi:hypothetical protein